MFATYVGSALNVIVIAVALLVPAVQRSTATFEKQVDRRQQDMRAISAAGSLLIEISKITGPGGLFDEDACLRPDPLNAYDQARLGMIQRRSDDLRSQVFAQGASTTTQFAEEAAMVRMAYSLENARTILPAKPYQSLGEGSRIAFCLSARNDLLDQARDTKDITLEGIAMTFAPIGSTLIDKDRLSPVIAAQGKTMHDDIAGIELPKNTTEEVINKYAMKDQKVVVFRRGRPDR